MKFQPGQRVRFRALQTEKVYRGTIVRSLKDGFYLVDDGTGRAPRVVHGNRLGTAPKPECRNVFA